MSSQKRKNIFPALIFIMLFVSALAFLPAVIAGDNASTETNLPVSAGDISASDIAEPQLPPEPEKPDAATLMFGGDILIHKSVYKQALDTIIDWAVEVPVYQRQNCIVFSTERINIDTLTPDITTFWGWMSDIELLEMR